MVNVITSLQNEIEGIAVRSNVFSAQEIAILREVTENYVKQPDADYSLITVGTDDRISGFILFGQTPATKSTWDLYWIAVDPLCQGKGVGQQLMNALEERLKSSSTCPVVRIETSSRPEYASARRLYLKSGFSQAGQIEHFYAPDDHLLIYAKQMK